MGRPAKIVKLCTGCGDRIPPSAVIDGKRRELGQRKRCLRCSPFRGPQNRVKRVCRNCGENFPGSVVIDGKRRDLSPRKYCLTCSPWGDRNSQQLEKLRTDGMKTCLICDTDKPLNEFALKSGRCRPCYNTNIRQVKAAIKAHAVMYLGGACQQCGYDRCLAALEFHHREGNKEFAISQRKLVDFEALKQELDKCDLLCDRCHTEEHAGKEQYGWHHYVDTFPKSGRFPTTRRTERRSATG